MAVTSVQKLVTVAKVALNTSTSGDSMPGDTVALYNSGTVTVLLGGDDLSDTNGFRGLAPGVSMIVDIGTGDTLYGKVAAGSADGTVDVLKLR